MTLICWPVWTSGRSALRSLLPGWRKKRGGSQEMETMADSPLARAPSNASLACAACSSDEKVTQARPVERPDLSNCGRSELSVDVER